MNRLARCAVIAGLEQRLLLTNYTLLHYETHNNISFRDPGYTATISPPETGHFVHLGQPIHGQVHDHGGGTFTYIPDDYYVGPDYFIADFHNYVDYGEYGGITDNMYFLQIDLNVYLPPPHSEDDSTYDWEDPETNTVSTGVNYFVLEGNALSIEKENGVLKNDEDWRYEEAWDVLSAALKTGQIPGAAPGVDYDADYGDVSLAPDGSFTYTPFQSVFDDPSFAGVEDTFYYVAVDQFGVVGNVAKVTVDLAKVVITRQGYRKSDLSYGGFPLDTESIALPEGTTFSRAWVGERVSLQASVIGQVDAPMNFQWTIPNKVVKGYSATASSTYVHVTDMTANDYDDSSCIFYWVTKGGKTVTVVSSAVGQSSSSTGSMNVESPSTTFTATILHVTYDPITGWVRLGDWSANPITYGVIFNVNVASMADFPLGLPGSFTLTQTVSSTFTRTTAQGTESAGGVGIDGQFSYGSLSPQNSSTLNTVFDIGDWQDSPGSNLNTLSAGTLSYSRNDSFKTTLMFRPDDITQCVDDADNSIWVPLKSLQWSWGFSATRQVNGGWDVFTSPSSNYDMSLFGTETTLFPEFFYPIQWYIPVWW